MTRPGDENYVHGHHASVLAAHGARTAQNSAAYLLPHLSPGTTLLDVGFGPGSITADLAQIVAPAEVVGIEAAPDAVAAARALMDERGVDNVTLQSASVYELPFDDDSFDVVHCHQVLQYLTDPPAALREMARVARRVVAAREVDYAVMHWYPENQGMTDWLESYRQIARDSGGEPDASRHLRAWSNAAGLPALGEVTIDASAWTYTTHEVTKWWGDVQSARVLESEQNAKLKALGLGDERIAAMAADWRAWGEHPDAYFSMTHGELLLQLA